MSLARLISTTLLLVATTTPALADGIRVESWRGSQPWPSRYDRPWAGRYDPWDRHDRYDRWGRRDRHRHSPSVVYVLPSRPRIYAPPPAVVYVPPPVYAAPPVAYQPPLQAMPTSPAYVDTRGRYCREFQSQGIVNGQPAPMWGTACQQPDGSWQIVE